MKIRKLQYGPREDEASKIFIISLLCLTGSGTISIHTGRLQIFDAPQKQNEPIWNALKRNLELEYKKVLHFYLLWKVRTLRD